MSVVSPSLHGPDLLFACLPSVLFIFPIRFCWNFIFSQVPTRSHRTITILSPQLDCTMISDSKILTYVSQCRNVSIAMSRPIHLKQTGVTRDLWLYIPFLVRIRTPTSSNSREEYTTPLADHTTGWIYFEYNILSRIKLYIGKCNMWIFYQCKANETILRCLSLSLHLLLYYLSTTSFPPSYYVYDSSLIRSFPSPSAAPFRYLATIHRLSSETIIHSFLPKFALALTRTKYNDNHKIFPTSKQKAKKHPLLLSSPT